MRRAWTIPYVAIEAAAIAPGEQPEPCDPPPEPVPTRGRVEFTIGDEVTFDHGITPALHGSWQPQRRTNPASTGQVQTALGSSAWPNSHGDALMRPSRWRIT